MIGDRIVVNDLMQSGYTYELLEAPGEGFDPDFNPQLTPEEMLRMGVFGGRYMRDCIDEFPSDWFTDAKFARDKADLSLNYFGVQASQSLAEWRRKGWLYEHDPRGWFQWYCRYFMGRRCPDDVRQIKRWRAMTRHIGQIRNNCPPGDLACRPRQRQALLHWAYDSRLY